MPKIQVLSQHVANQIAAGEVVERPASVVKELVENSIDAGATFVSVEIEEGGTASIIVSDNGSGIPKDECKAAFLRHATSKIKSADDLYSISTLGFRGEALASIASVSDVEMCTKTRDTDCGTRLAVSNGVFGELTDTACNDGTTISVRNLFLNIPARLKFLKTSRTEAGYIGDYMARAILAHPNIEFRYISSGRNVYQTAGDGDLLKAIYSVYGPETAENLLPLNYDNGFIKIEGYIGNPDLAKPNRTYQSIFINGRYIKSSSLSYTLSRAYETKLMTGRFPFAIVKITISSKEVDVNVHPTKMEVRFTDDNRVNSCVYSACIEALSKLDFVPLPTTNPIPYENPTAYNQSFDQKIQYTPERGTAAGFKEPAYNAVRADRFFESIDNIRRSIPQTSLLPDVTDMKIIGCAFSTFWLVEWRDTLYIIDQHAAHERVLYNKLVNKETTFSSQQLLIPRSMTVIPSDFERLEAYKEQLEKLGFTWENAETNRIRIKSVPQLNGRVFDERYLYDCIELIASEKENISKELMNEKLIQCACKHAIKGGDVITQDELFALLLEFSEHGIPLTCPHGRPVIVRLGKTDLEKMFKRVQ